jgi:HK97 family phage major capsid protein
MDPKELEQMLADAAKKGAESVIAAQEKAAQEKALKEKADAEFETRVKAAVAAVTPTTTGADRLLAEVEKRFADAQEENKKALDGLHASLVEKAQELEAIQKSRMQFQETSAPVTYADKEKAVLIAKMSGKPLESTKFGREVVEKAGAHMPSNTWELEVSLNMENEVRRRLVVAPTMRSIAMRTNVMTIPVNPEAGVASWVQNANFGSSSSAGNNLTHAVKEITLNAYKVATNEYVAFEEEEDALLAIMPVVRDGMIRRVARAVDRAMLRGAGSGGDPVKGLVEYDAASAVTLGIGAAAKLTVARLQSIRRDIGAWGLDPSELIYIVSTEGYYDLLEDTSFQTVDKVGAQATILTGQIGLVGNTPVLVSAEYAAVGTGAAAALVFHPGNFLIGNQRGMRMDTDDLVETQRRVMVASMRTGMTQVTTNLGGAISVIRYVA